MFKLTELVTILFRRLKLGAIATCVMRLPKWVVLRFQSRLLTVADLKVGIMHDCVSEMTCHFTSQTNSSIEEKGIKEATSHSIQFLFCSNFGFKIRRPGSFKGSLHFYLPKYSSIILQWDSNRNLNYDL